MGGIGKCHSEQVLAGKEWWSRASVEFTEDEKHQKKVTKSESQSQSLRCVDHEVLGLEVRRMGDGYSRKKRADGGAADEVGEVKSGR